MDKKKDNQIIIRIICIIASFVFWLYIANTENPQIDRQITVQIQVENVGALAKSRLALLGEQEYEVSFRVKGPMLEINALNSKKFSLKADLSSVFLTKGINRIPVYVESMPSDIQIMDRENLKVDILLDNLIEKSVPVKVHIPVNTKEGYVAFTPIIRPSSVSISGAEQYVNSVSYVQAKTELKNAEKDEELNLPLSPFDEVGRIVKDVSVNPQVVNVVIPVKKTKTVNISVDTTGNIGQGLILESIEAIPSTIEIAGDEGVLNSIYEIKTEPIDLSEITADKEIDTRLILDRVVTVSGVNNISVKVNVDNIKQKNLSVKIKFDNLGDNLEYDTNNANISLVLIGAESLMKNINDSTVECIVDIGSLGEGTHSIPINPVNIVVPSGVRIESVSPQRINVTITKKEEEPVSSGDVVDPSTVSE